MDKSEESIEAQRKRNRERWPEFAEVVDEFRKVFGEDVQVVSFKPPNWKE